MNNTRPFSGIPPVVKTLIIINVIVFFLTEMIDRRFDTNLSRVLGLLLPQSDYWSPYQYITYMFMHGSISHLFFNMFALYMFGRILESVWGSKRFLIFYFVCGVGAAALNSVIGWIEVNHMYTQFEAFKNTPDPDLFINFVRAHPITHDFTPLIDEWLNNPASPSLTAQATSWYEVILKVYSNIPMVGASGAIFGILLAFGMLFPNTELFLMFVPIPIKAKYFVLGYGILEFYMGIQNSSGDNVAHFAHLGGMLFGFILVKLWSRNRKAFY